MRLALVAFVLLSASPLRTTLQAAERPNVLIVMADDCTFSDLPLYGGQNARTPRIDRLASQGLVFNRAYLAQAICQPCRSELYSGLFPVRNGSAWNHSACRPETKSLPHYLQPLGYRVGIAGKVHVKPEPAFPFEHVGGFDDNCVRNPTQPHDTAAIAKFLSEPSPFCLVVCLVEPHVPWVMGDASKYPPRSLKLPPHLADTPATRKAFSHYLAEITYMDGQVGELLDVLEVSGKADETLVLFTSEQGAQFPGGKWTNWDVGVHTALVARWPGRIEPGERTDAIVQYADVAATVIELAGGKPEDLDLDGRSFTSILADPAKPHREYAFGIHNNVPEGPPYPVRTVTNGEYRYIRNLTPNELYIEKHLMGTRENSLAAHPYWSSWMFNTFDSPNTERLVKRYMQRPAEQLYHTKSDPFEMTNLADDPKYDDIRRELSARLDGWMESQGDPGAAMDTREALRDARQGKHPRKP